MLSGLARLSLSPLSLCVCLIYVLLDDNLSEYSVYAFHSISLSICDDIIISKVLILLSG